MRVLFGLTLALLAAGCSSKGSTATSPSGPDPLLDGGPDASALVAARPYTLVVPASYDKTQPTPLVFMMHGYSSDGAEEEAYMQLSATADKEGFLYAYADGTVDAMGQRFWNATDACCNFGNLPVDDVAYIDAIVADIASKYNVDPKRFFLVGHSNGGFMAHRYACDRAEKVAAIVSLAGDNWEDPSLCNPSVPVAVVQVHGDQDTEILYDGGFTTDFDGGMHEYPSAPQSVGTWASKNPCGQTHVDGGTLSLDTGEAPGATQIDRYAGCADTTDVELWTMHGSGHIPFLDATWGESVWGFFAAHPKP